ncbi:MAG: localization factor PodJL [Gammaproteobacteria bacterium]|jgi:localization factor PodJL
MYQNGKGVPLDYVESVKWYRKAADQGDPEGQFNLGTMYEHGLGVPKDYQMARSLYFSAARKGDPNALMNLGIMRWNGDGFPKKDLVCALAWWLRADAQGHERAAEYMGRALKHMTSEEIDAARIVSLELAKRISSKWQGQTNKSVYSDTAPTQALVRDVQAALTAKGYDPGPVDGRWGKKTRSAVKQFQSSVGLPASGTVTPELLMLLKAK